MRALEAVKSVFVQALWEILLLCQGFVLSFTETVGAAQVTVCVASSTFRSAE